MAAARLQLVVCCIALATNTIFVVVRNIYILCSVASFTFTLAYHTGRSRIFHPCDLLLHFPPLRSTPAYSTPAYSTPTFWCLIFHFRIFHPCIFTVSNFPFLNFQSPLFHDYFLLVGIKRKGHAVTINYDFMKLFTYVSSLQHLFHEFLFAYLFFFLTLTSL